MEMEVIAKAQSSSTLRIYTQNTLVGVRNDKRNLAFGPFCLKRVTLSTLGRPKLESSSTKITRGLLQLHLWNSNEPIIHSNVFTYPTRLKLSGHFTLTSLYTGFWLNLRETDKYLREINKCPRANLPAGSILLASLASDVDFKCPSDPHGSLSLNKFTIWTKTREKVPRQS